MSCLFDSLSKFTTHSGSDLRQHIVSYLRTNPTLMENITFEELMTWDNQDVHVYTDQMSQEQTWGGAIEIKAFVDIFKVNVHVHIPSLQKIVEFQCPSEQIATHCIHLLWTGNHYVPMGCNELLMQKTQS